jgi:hypothetical protein
MMSRCRAIFAPAKPLVSAPSPSGACTVPVPRSWRSLLHVPVALRLPLARAPTRWNREGRGSSDHRRSSPATALIQRIWRNLALKASLQSPQSGLKSNVTFSKSPGRIMPRFRPFQWLLVALPARQPAGLRRWRQRTYSAPQRSRPIERRKGRGRALEPAGINKCEKKASKEAV